MGVCSTNELIQTQFTGLICGASSARWWFTSVSGRPRHTDSSLSSLLQTAAVFCLHECGRHKYRKGEIDKKKSNTRQEQQERRWGEVESDACSLVKNNMRALPTLHVSWIHSLGISHVYLRTDRLPLLCPSSCSGLVFITSSIDSYVVSAPAGARST